MGDLKASFRNTAKERKNYEIALQDRLYTLRLLQGIRISIATGFDRSILDEICKQGSTITLRSIQSFSNKLSNLCVPLWGLLYPDAKSSSGDTSMHLSSESLAKSYDDELIPLRNYICDYISIFVLYYLLDGILLFKSSGAKSKSVLSFESSVREYDNSHLVLDYSKCIPLRREMTFARLISNYTVILSNDAKNLYPIFYISKVQRFAEELKKTTEEVPFKDYFIKVYDRFENECIPTLVNLVQEALLEGVERYSDLKGVSLRFGSSNNIEGIKNYKGVTVTNESVTNELVNDINSFLRIRSSIEEGD